MRRPTRRTALASIARTARTLTLAALAAAALAAPAAAQAKLPNDSLELGRKWAEWFLTGRADSVAAYMMPDALASVRGVSGIQEGQAMVAERAGSFKKLIEERFVWRNGARQYWRVMEMTVIPEPFVLRFVMRSDGLIAGIGLGPLSAVPPIDSSGPSIKP